MSKTEQFRVTVDYLREQGLSETFPARFFSKVRITESCWIWTAGCDSDNYGVISKGAKTVGEMHAHRASWILHFGPIPEGQNVCHDCPDGDNPRCVNPAHLWIGGDAENIQDALDKGRWTVGEHHKMSKLNASQVYEIRILFNQGCSQTAISKNFNISLSQVNRIVREMSWRHLIG